MQRRRKGTGTIIKTGDWYYGRIVRHGKVSVIKLSKNQRDAEGLWRKWLDEHRDVPARETALHSLDDAWTRLLSSCHARNASDTLIADKRRLFLRFREWMIARGKLNLEDIDTDDIVLCLAECTKGSSMGRQRGFISVARGLWANSMPDAKNPAEKVRPKWVEATSREAFTNEEVARLLEEAGRCKNSSEMVPLIKTALYTGLRLKDCVFLSVGNIRGDVIELPPRKTMKKGIWVRIPLHPELKKCLDGITPDENGHFFPVLIGLYLSGSMTEALHRLFSRCFETSRMGHGGVRRVPVKTFHSLRATFITRLAESGVSLPIMESLAGHLDPRQTLHYTHPDEETKKAAIDVLPTFGSKGVPREIFVHPEMKKVIELCGKLIDGKMRELAGMLRREGTMAYITENGNGAEADTVKTDAGYEIALQMARDEVERLRNAGFIR